MYGVVEEEGECLWTGLAATTGDGDDDGTRSRQAAVGASQSRSVRVEGGL